jgi:hypothetical protein
LAEGEDGATPDDAPVVGPYRRCMTTTTDGAIDEQAVQAFAGH